MKQDEKNIDDRKDSVLRFQIIFAVLVVAGIYVLGKGLQTMLPPRSQYWEEVEKRDFVCQKCKLFSPIVALKVVFDYNISID